MEGVRHFFVLAFFCFQPISIARAGEDGDIFAIGNTKNRSPKSDEELVTELKQLTEAPFGNTSAEHSEGVALMRLREKVGGDLSQFDEIHLATAGRWVCGRCVGSRPDNISGLEDIATQLGIKKLIIRAEHDSFGGNGRTGSFQDEQIQALFERDGQVTILNGQIQGL